MTKTKAPTDANGLAITEGADARVPSACGDQIGRVEAFGPDFVSVSFEIGHGSRYSLNVAPASVFLVSEDNAPKAFRGSGEPGDFPTETQG